jgi:hypothetical protein
VENTQMNHKEKMIKKTENAEEGLRHMRHKEKA